MQGMKSKKAGRPKMERTALRDYWMEVKKRNREWHRLHERVVDSIERDKKNTIVSENL